MNLEDEIHVGLEIYAAGFPLGDGSGPAQGRELHGPTAAVLSATKWDHR